MTRVIIHKQHSFLQLSQEGLQPLPVWMAAELEKPMSYTALIQLEIETGPHAGRRFVSEPRAMFRYSPSGLYQCQRGYLPRIRQMLETWQVPYEVVDLDEPVDPKIFQIHFERIFEHGVEPRPGQLEAIAQIDMFDGGIIDAVTAFGKAYVILMVCLAYPHAKIDIVTKSQAVAQRLRQLLIKYIPNIGIVSSKAKKQRGRVTLYTADSLGHSDFKANIVLCDEVHQLVTDRLATWISRYHTSRLYGFTASKETRSDNLWARMEGLFGPTVFYMDYPTAQNLGLVCPILVDWREVNISPNPAEFVPKHDRKRYGIWVNHARNQIVAKAAMDYVNQGNQVLIAVETVTHALYLRQLLPFFALAHAENAITPKDRESYINAGLLKPDDPVMTTQRRAWLQQSFERRETMYAIANGVWSTGVSFDSLEVQIRAAGAGSDTMSIQEPGRVARTSLPTGKSYGVVVDFADNFDDGFKKAYQQRRRVYAQNGWTQVMPNGDIFEGNQRRTAAHA